MMLSCFTKFSLISATKLSVVWSKLIITSNIVEKLSFLKSLMIKFLISFESFNDWISTIFIVAVEFEIKKEFLFDEIFFKLRKTRFCFNCKISKHIAVNCFKKSVKVEIAKLKEKLKQKKTMFEKSFHLKHKCLFREIEFK